MKQLTILVLALVVLFGLEAQQNQKTLSVTTFSNTSARSEYSWLNTALSDMLTTDLSASKKLTVVQRNRLSELLKEQEFQASGIVDEKSAVAAGKILGADTLVFGDFILVGGNKIRINANLVSVQSGKSLGAASVSGLTEDIFVLEKQLAGRLLETLGIVLTDAERIDLFQMPSRSAAALEQNYRGVLAMESNDLDAARSLFEKATQSDPFYRDARRNLEKASFNFSGTELAKSAADDASRRAAQLKASTIMRDDLLRNLFIFKVNGSPRILRTDAKTQTADVGIDWSVSYNPETIRHLMAFLKDLSQANQGDEDCRFSLLPPGANQVQKYEFRMYTESMELLFDHSWQNENHINAYWLPSFSLNDAQGKTGAEILFPVRYLSSEGDMIGDDTTIQIYSYGSIATPREMHTGTVWILPVKWKERGLRAETRLAVLKGIKQADLANLTVVKVALAAVRLRNDDLLITF